MAAEQALTATDHDVPNKQDFFIGAGIHFVVEERDRSNLDVTLQVGQSCDFPNNVFSGSHLLAQLSQTAPLNESFANGTRQVVLVRCCVNV